MGPPVIFTAKSMTVWHRENGYIRLHAIIASYDLAQFLFERHHEHPDAWTFIEIGAELNELQFLKVQWELTTQ